MPSINIKITHIFFAVFVLLLKPGGVQAQQQAITKAAQLERDFKDPPPAASPWVFWYWMQAAVTKAGITADLEAMKEAGIGGAYLMPIKDTANPPLLLPAIRQLTPEWWGMVRFAMEEAKRLNLQLGMHVSDGFALAGGPWIKPEQSMQKLTWSKKLIAGGPVHDTLLTPVANEGFYRDIAVYAYPVQSQLMVSQQALLPVVTSSKTGVEAQFVAAPAGKETFRSDDSCWIQFAYPGPFTCRNILISTGGNNYQAQRLIVEVSDDGITFRRHTRLEAPRHGWQDTDAGVTHAIEPVTAKYFRFIYSKTGSEPGAEDLDAAKWKPVLRVKSILLSGEPMISQFEGKAGYVWRISRNTTIDQLPDSLCVPMASIINITEKMDANGVLNWDVPAGNWMIVRLGHTSTGHTNATAGAGKGLECDKFSKAAVTLQFNNWFGKAFEECGPVAKDVLKYFHVDSWECGSQNWSDNFAAEFEKRRGYAPGPMLLAMTGIPVESAASSERFLHDVRLTVAELVKDVFYATLAELSHAKGCQFTAESVAPTMLGDGLLHYSLVDVPMGEFWLNSPTHDKPNDMLDAVTAGHIYGKNIIQSESFTTLRMAWNEYPGMLKTLQDRNYALGINRIVYHVFTHNPWTDRKPGMTLDGVGLYFQRDQTWWKPGKAWVDYAKRCQALLQMGRPVADIAVFTGDDLPRRSILPDRLVETLPGLFGKQRVASEANRLDNDGEPLRTIPDGVTHSANMADPQDWTNPLNGYAYDSFNPDVLQQATVKDGRIVLPGGGSYGVLVLPLVNSMMPNADRISAASASKILELVQAGATVIMGNEPVNSWELKDNDLNDNITQAAFNQLQGGVFTAARNMKDSVYFIKKLGNGSVIKAPYAGASLDGAGLHKDLIATDSLGKYATYLAYTHRTDKDFDIYFISNQIEKKRYINFSLRTAGRVPELWNAVTGEILSSIPFKVQNYRTEFALELEANASVFVVFRKSSAKYVVKKNFAGSAVKSIRMDRPWLLGFDTSSGQHIALTRMNKLESITNRDQENVKYFSGTMRYSSSLNIAQPKAHAKLGLGRVADIAEVFVNGKFCGVAWTYPYSVDISGALKAGNNTIEVAVSNTWHNRLIGDQLLPADKRLTNTTAPFRLAGKPLAEAGLLGPVTIDMW